LPVLRPDRGHRLGQGEGQAGRALGPPVAAARPHPRGPGGAAAREGPGRPGPPEEAVEGPLLERYQVAGVALTVFLAILLPFLYLREPARQKAAASKELTESVRLGQATFTEFCARCHGPNAEGGTVERYVTPGVKGAKPTDFPAP